MSQSDKNITWLVQKGVSFAPSESPTHEAMIEVEQYLEAMADGIGPSDIAEWSEQDIAEAWDSDPALMAAVEALVAWRKVRPVLDVAMSWATEILGGDTDGE